MNVQQFIDALRAVEDHGDVEPMAALYAPEARLWNPYLHAPLRGAEGARQFWDEYRRTFSTVRSTFQSMVEGNNIVALEWNSSGHLAQTETAFQYRGATVVEWNEAGITRFATYFDPQRLTAGAPASPSTSATSADADVPPLDVNAVGESYSRPLP